MSRSEARTYYQMLQARLSNFSGNLPDGLQDIERSRVEETISKLYSMTERALLVLEDEDPRHPGL